MTKTRSVDTRSPEARQVSRDLAEMALAWVEQEGHLRVRQREGLRRSLSAAAEMNSWTLITGDSAEIANSDVLKLAKSGARVLTKERAEEIAAKKTELTQLKRSQKAIQKLADTADFEEPIETTYTHTVRKPSRGLVTRVEEIVLADAQEAIDAVNAIEKRIETWGKLREEMLGELKKKAEQLEEMKRQLPAFVDSSMGLVHEVFATLY